jgi:hypothetical protein
MRGRAIPEGNDKIFQKKKKRKEDGWSATHKRPWGGSATPGGPHSGPESPLGVAATPPEGSLWPSGGWCGHP